ncbi:MAG: hemerythrin domain-containing protein [Armatimonadota bacterium]
MSHASPLDELRREHQMVLADIADIHTAMRETATSTERAHDALRGSLRSRLDMFRQGILLHFRREEECLYPDVRLLVAQGAHGADILGQFLRSEAEEDMRAHQVIAARTEEIASLLAAGEQQGGLPALSLSHLRTLVGLTHDLVTRHAEKEDKMVFPLIERNLSGDQLAIIYERLRSVRAVSDLSGPEGLGELQAGADAGSEGGRVGSSQYAGGGQGLAYPPTGAPGTNMEAPSAGSWQPRPLGRRVRADVKRASSIPVYVIYVILLGAGISGGWYYQVLDILVPNSPRATAKAFMRLIYEGDIDGAGEFCTSETQPLLASLKQQSRSIKAAAEAAAKKGQPWQLSWRAATVETAGDQATVTIDQTVKQGTTVQSLALPLALSKENGKWRVSLTTELEPLIGLSPPSGTGTATPDVTPWVK